MDYTIRQGQKADIDRIMEIYAIARQFMIDHDNPNQWKNSRPTRDQVEKDIREQKNYVIEAEGCVEAVFFMANEDDPTYAAIEGKWINPGGHYAVIHRVASSGKIHGVLEKAVSFALKTNSNLRIDTHEDNYVMQGAITKCGFTRCGIITLENGEPRIAYERV